MKVLIISLGFLLGVTGVFTAHVSADRCRQKGSEVRRLTSEILDLKQEISALKNFHPSEAVHLDEAYTAFMNDMHIIAGAHRVACALSVQGRRDADVGGGAVPSMFSGLREVRFHGVFSGVVRRTILLSLLDALSAFEKGSPVLFENISHEKDVLIFDAVVIGL